MAVKQSGMPIRMAFPLRSNRCDPLIVYVSANYLNGFSYRSTAIRSSLATTFQLPFMDHLFS